MSIALGTLYTFAHVFPNDLGVAADPGVVKFYAREHVDGTELEWTYNVSPVAGTHYPVGMNPIVRNSAGNYDLDYVARKPERVTGFWLGTGTIFDSVQQTLFVRHAESATVDPPSS